MRFILGFVIGAAGGVAAVYFTAPRSGPAQRRELKSLWDGAVEASREASAARSQDLWAEYRARVQPHAQ